MAVPPRKGERAAAEWSRAGDGPARPRSRAPCAFPGPARPPARPPPGLLVAELLRDHLAQLQAQPVGHALGQVLVRAAAEEHDVGHGGGGGGTGGCDASGKARLSTKGGAEWKGAAGGGVGAGLEGAGRGGAELRGRRRGKAPRRDREEEELEGAEPRKGGLKRERSGPRF